MTAQEPRNRTPEPEKPAVGAAGATKTAEVMHIDLDARKRLLAVIGGNRVTYCYQCGACVGDCPSARFYEGFNPREIMLTVLLGGLDELLCPDSIIWKCSNCYNCYERCPQDVRPVEVIIALKNLIKEDGHQPQDVQSIYETILKTGRSAPVIAGLARTRERLGLPPLPPIDMAEIQAILKPDTAEEGRGPENELGKRS
ncbi:MAG: 4Fe-4S dicluster domain-containing protein [Candidatus Eisenbacteria sp.]|nr:4Fe-4S dicluster domain-containing protein [Candidatus Eisenbacteria bacterium]